MTADDQNRQVVVVGAGPAGLTAAYELTKNAVKPLVLEQGDRVGGLARTENHNGYRFDMGGHRFFTKVEAVNELWHEVMGEDFLCRPRLSRIFYHNRFFYYPLRIFNVLKGVGLWEAAGIIFSYLQAKVFPPKRQDTVDQWMTRRFGKKLYETFFKTYTEKVWGIPCTQIKAEWAYQRIRELSLKTILVSMVSRSKDSHTSLIEEFEYPRLGPGMLWERVRDEIEQRGGIVSPRSEVIKFNRKGNRIDSVVVLHDGEGNEVIPGTDFISSIPLVDLIHKLDDVPENVLEAAEKIRYRDFLTVCLIINQPALFPDNWIYIHSPEVKVGRIQNFKNWSPEMVADPAKTSLGLEYFCTEGDEIWRMADDELIHIGINELDRIGLARAADVEGGFVYRVPKAYPVYDADYQNSLGVIREFIGKLENFQTIGRNGLHRYNNMDHSMVTAMLAVRNVLFQEKNDLWNVNTDQEYLEEAKLSPESQAVSGARLELVFLKLDPLAFGLSSGITTALVLLIATLWLVIKGGLVVGPNLLLLDQYFPGFTVSFRGAGIGMLYGLLLGFILGWGFAYLRNLAILISMILIQRDIESLALRRLLDYL